MDLNITREALSQYENGKREPGQKMLIRMSEYFDVSIHYLITGHEFHKKHPDPPGIKPAIGVFPHRRAVYGAPLCTFS